MIAGNYTLCFSDIKSPSGTGTGRAMMKKGGTGFPVNPGLYAAHAKEKFETCSICQFGYRPHTHPLINMVDRQMPSTIVRYLTLPTAKAGDACFNHYCIG